MSEYSDILNKLRMFNYMRKDLEVCHDAADAIEALEKRVQKQQAYILLLVEKLCQEPTEIKRLEKNIDQLQADLKALSETK